MRMTILGVAAASAVMAGGAGPVMPTSLTDTTIISPADLDAMVAEARANRRPDQPTVITPLISVPPGAVNLEVRVSPGPAAAHPGEPELFYVLQGSGEITTGGMLVPGPAPAGASIQGGVTRVVSKGDFVLVPPGLPHAFT